MQRAALEIVAAIAAGQWGMFTAAQARQDGVGRTELSRLANRAIVRSIRHGVYVMSGVPSGPLEDARAQWLATDPTRTAGGRRDDSDQVVVSDESAAIIHRIGDLPPGGIHLSAARRLQTRQKWVTIHRRSIPPQEYEFIDGLPVTTPRRTLEDLAESGRWDAGQLADLVADAITTGLMPVVRS